MGGDPFKKVQPGQKVAIPAEAYNGFVDAALALRRHRHSNEQDSASDFRQSGIIRVKNNSGAARSRYQVLGLDSPIVAPGTDLDSFKQQVALVGSTPATTHQGRFAVLLEPLADGAIGRAYVAGVCLVQIDVTDSSHGFADVANGDAAKLRSAGSGAAQVLWKESGTGTKWAVVRLAAGSSLGLVLFKLTASLAQGGSAAATAMLWNSGASDWQATGDAITVYDAPRFGPASTNDRGVCMLSPSSSRYEIISLPPGQSSQLVPFHLYEDLAAGTSADATILEWDDGTETWSPTGPSITVHDAVNFGPAQQYDRGWCRFDPESDRYEIVSLPPGEGLGLTLFYLNANLEKGGSASANVMQWNAGLNIWQATGPLITVYDSANFGPAKQYDRGVCILSPASNRQEIVSLPKGGGLARRAEFAAIQPMAKNETETIVTATLFYDGTPPFVAPGPLLVMNSRNIFELQPGKKGVAVYKPELGIWEIDWAECGGQATYPGNLPGEYGSGYSYYGSDGESGSMYSGDPGAGSASPGSY